MDFLEAKVGCDVFSIIRDIEAAMITSTRKELNGVVDYLIATGERMITGSKSHYKYSYSKDCRNWFTFPLRQTVETHGSSFESFFNRRSGDGRTYYTHLYWVAEVLKTCEESLEKIFGGELEYLLLQFKVRKVLAHKKNVDYKTNIGCDVIRDLVCWFELQELVNYRIKYPKSVFADETENYMDSRLGLGGGSFYRSNAPWPEPPFGDSDFDVEGLSDIEFYRIFGRSRD